MTSSSPLPPLSRLYREHFEAVWAVLRRLGVPSASLEDGVHDVFMVVHRQRERFEGRSTARTWILGIARRVAARQRRTHHRTQRRHLALASAPRTTPDLDDDLARREAWHALQGFLEELDEEKRAAFVLGELERLNRQELGAALGISPNTAYSRLRAARAQFQVRFAEAGARPVLAAGRHLEPAPAESRERAWLLVTASMGESVAPVVSVASLASAKALLATVGLAAAVLGGVAVVGHGRIEEPADSRLASTESSPAVRGETRLDEPRLAEASDMSAPPIEPAHPSSGAEPEPRSARSRRPAPPPAALGRPRAAAEDLEAEAALLSTARAALAGERPRAAIAALDEHRARFPEGLLTEEREASRIRALCALDQPDAARRELRELAARFPRSAYLEALRESCPASVIGPRSGGDPPG